MYYFDLIMYFSSKSILNVRFVILFFSIYMFEWCTLR